MRRLRSPKGKVAFLVTTSQRSAALAVRNELGNSVTSNAAKQSARRTGTRLTAASTLTAGLASEGKLKIAAAICDLNTGVVSYLD